MIVFVKGVRGAFLVRMPSAWESFVATHRPGDIVRGKVSRFTSFGIFVELGEGLEGLCHISELSDERVESADQVAKLGEEMDFKILRIEYEDQKIGLSRRAVGKDDEPVVDTKMYSTEAKGGMSAEPILPYSVHVTGLPPRPRSRPHGLWECPPGLCISAHVLPKYQTG